MSRPPAPKKEFRTRREMLIIRKTGLQMLDRTFAYVRALAFDVLGRVVGVRAKVLAGVGLVVSGVLAGVGLGLAVGKNAFRPRFRLKVD